MMGNTELERLLRASSTSFNAAKSKDQEKGRYRFSISVEEPIKRDLTQHDLSGIFFYHCHFVGCNFGSMFEASFNSCTFEDCTFLSRNGIGQSGGPSKLCDVVFYECTFDGTRFDRAHLEDVKFVEPVLKSLPSFNKSLLKTRLVYDQDPPSVGFLDAIANAESSPNLDVDVIGELSTRKLSWETIRVAAKLPFLQISLVGVTALSIFTILVSDISQPFVELYGHCVKLANEGDGVLASFQAVCERIAATGVNATSVDGVFWLFVSFYVIFAGSLIQTIKCPEEINEFSRAKWVQQLRRPSAVYTALSIREPKWIAAAAALQALGLIIFIFKTVRALLGMLF